MTAIDRSKFKSTSVAASKQAEQVLDAITGKGKGASADYHKITPGTHYYRIYPPHPDGKGELYAEAKGVHWLPVEVTEFDKQGKPVKENGKNKTKIANRPLFNAKIHGGKKRDL